MGKIADIVTAPEFAEKSPLEKAQARRDLFAVALDENPDIKAQFETADDAGKQTLADQFKAKLNAEFADAFTTKGFRVEVASDGSHTAYETRTPVYDITTEQLLARTAPLAARGNGGLSSWNDDALRLKELPADVRKTMAPFIYERFGTADMLEAPGKPLFGTPADFIEKDETTGKKVLRVAIPAALRIGPTAIASVTKNPKAIAGAAAVGDAAAQMLEKAQGSRATFSPIEMGLNAGLSIIPAATIGKFSNPALNMAVRTGVRAAEGAAQGAVFEGVRQAVDEDQFSGEKIALSAGFGAGLGGLVGALEPRIAAMLSGKTAKEAKATLEDAIAKATTPEQKAAFISAQQRIDEFLRIGAEGKPAADSAAALSAEFPPVVKSAAESAQVLGGEPYKSQRQLDVESALNEADALNRSPTGAAGLRAGMTAEEAAARVGNRTGSVTPESAVPMLESGTATDPRLVSPASDPLGNRMIPSVETDVGQGGRVRPAWDAPAAAEQGIVIPIYNRRPVGRPSAGTAEGAGSLPPPPGVAPSGSVPGQGAAMDATPADSVSGQAPASGAQIPKARKGFSVGLSPGGEMDLLSHIEALGGIRGPRSVKAAGGEYDGFAEVFREGPQRLLVRNARGPKVDQLMQELTEVGFKFETPDDLYRAISKAAETRKKLAKSLGDAEYGAKFDAALFENAGRKTHLNTSDPVNVDTLNVGDSFKVRGEPVKVQSIDPDTGAVTVKDGVQREIPAGTEVFPDKGEVQKSAGDSAGDDFAPPDEGGSPNDLFGDSMPFNLASERQVDAGGPVARGEPTSEMFSPDETRSMPPTEMDKRNAQNTNTATPEVKRVFNAFGFVAPKLAASLGGGAGGFVYGASTGEDPVDRVKRGLAFGVMGLGGGYMLGKRFLTPKGGAPVRPGMDVIADVDKVLTKPDGVSLSSRISGAPEAARAAFITRFAPLDVLETNVLKAAGASAPEIPISRKFEQVAGAGGKALIDVQDFENAVLPTVAGNERDFDRLLFLKRTGQRLQADASLAIEKARIAGIPAAARTPDEVATLALPDNRRRVSDWTLDKVDRGLEQLETAIGSQRFAELDQAAAGAFQQELDRGLQLQVQAGRISPEAYTAIKSTNDFYAPFRVLRTLEDIDAGRVAPGIDTRQQIVNAITGIDDTDFRLDSPTKAAAENIFNGRILAEKNLKMLELAKLADVDTNGLFIRKLKSWQTPRKEYELVNYFEAGVPMRLEVAPQVAEAVKGLNPTQTGIVGELAKRMGAVFRFGATSGNLAFQVRNIAFADQPRLLLMSKYGANVGDVINPLRIPMDFTSALLSSIRSNVFGKKDGLARAFYESGAAGSTLQDAISNIGGRFDPGSAAQRTQGAGRDVIDKFEDMTRVLEETTKMMGFKRGIRIEGVDRLPPDQAAKKLEAVVAEVRNFAGSPDFARGGRVAKDLSMVTLFFNARLQGGASDLNRLGGGDGAKAAVMAWTRLGAAAGIPAAYFWLRNQEPENKADFEKVPSWEREGYVMVPRYDDKGAPLYFTNTQGEKVREYWRIPKRESTATISNLTEAALEFANSKDPAAIREFAANFVEQMSPLNITGNDGSERIESVKGSLNPIIKVPLEVTGNRDFFRHRDIVPQSRAGGSPENQFFAGSTPQGYVDAANAMPQFLWNPLRSPLMLQHIVSSTTGGFINQFAPERQRPGTRDPQTSAIAANPVGRVFVRSQQNDNADAEADVADAKRGVRDRQIQLSNSAAAELDALAKMPEGERAGRVAAVAESQPELVEAIADEMEKRAKGFNSVDRVAATLPIRSGERAAFIFKQIMKKSPAERAAYLEDQFRKEIVNDLVLEQLAELISGGRN